MARAAARAGELAWEEAEHGMRAADPRAHGDIVLARKDAPASYHLASTLDDAAMGVTHRSEEHTSELQSLMRISYAVFCLKKKKINIQYKLHNHINRDKNTHTHNKEAV